MLVNGIKEIQRDGYQYAYHVTSHSALNSENQEMLRLRNFGAQVYPVRKVSLSAQREYNIMATELEMQNLRQTPIIQAVSKATVDTGFIDLNVFPHSPDFSWNSENFGPFSIPYKGMKVPIEKRTLDLYGDIIKRYESNQSHISDDGLSVNGAKVEVYTFKKDYYFMLGDNRSASVDSRFRGVVPEDHIIGQVSKTIYSAQHGWSVFMEDIR